MGSLAKDFPFKKIKMHILVEVGGVDDIAAEWCTCEVAVATFAT